jgi:hypothetical protein
MNCLLSNKLLTSNANDDMVVNEPQKPNAKRNEYFGSRFHVVDKTEKIPKIKLPVTLTIKTFNGSPPNTSGDSTILYLRKAPNIAPIPNNTNSNPFKLRISFFNNLRVRYVFVYHKHF